MGSRFPSHQLSNGLYVSGRPEQPKERLPTMVSKAVPYTGGDIRKSGELGKMFDIPVVDTTKLKKSGPVSAGGPSRTGSFGTTTVPSRSNSGPLPSNPGGRSGPLKKVSGPLSGGATPVARHNSGPLAPPLPPTGLITSGPISSGPLNSSGAPKRVPGHLESAPSAFVTSGNICWGKRAAISFLSAYPDAELRSAKNGQYVKVTGVVTCGSIPLEASYQKVSRCVYISTSLYEYRGWNAKPANPKHRRFTWGLRYLERHVTDFYISDFQSGLRALVKSGDGARVTPYVDTATVVDLTKKNRNLSPDFIRWLGERNLSSDDRVMRLKEGYIREGSTVSVMGVVQRCDNVLMIVPSPEPVSTGCQWRKFLLPSTLEGIVLRCEDMSKADVIPV